ncbi:MAG: hypothetical protein K0R29_1148 [Pseudobdellovibrio sp.]|jgi:hypothetical protein|nr:hypothetical protein [Pseudobdellovibrio sp.]
MKKTLLSLALIITTSAAMAVDVVAPAQTEDQKKAEQMAKENEAKKPSIEQKRAELKKKHAMKKADKAAKKEAAEMAKANAPKSNAESGDSTAAQMVKDIQNQQQTETNREDKNR